MREFLLELNQILFEDFSRRDLFDYYALNAINKSHAYYQALRDSIYDNLISQVSSALTRRSDPDSFTGEKDVWLVDLPRHWSAPLPFKIKLHDDRLSWEQTRMSIAGVKHTLRFSKTIDELRSIYPRNPENWVKGIIDQ